MGELLANAAGNVALGMGTVFAILILISLVIYGFKIIPIIQEKFSNRKTAVAPVAVKEAPAPAPAVPAPAVSAPVVTPAGDEVPVAVIAAAIAAYEADRMPVGPVAQREYAGEDFFVRSIKRRH